MKIFNLFINFNCILAQVMVTERFDWQWDLTNVSLKYTTRTPLRIYYDLT